ncbi:MAG: TonB-dependent receptor [Desulfobacterales bacterium]|nr:TonB-dependent receptor [Desulfobacterales bacterium]
MMSSQLYNKLPPGLSARTGGFLERENINVNLSAGYEGFYGDIQFNSTDSGVLDGSIPMKKGSVEEFETTTIQIGYRRELSNTIQIDGQIAHRSEYDYEKGVFYLDLNTGEEAYLELSGGEARLDAELDVIWKPSDIFSMIAGFSYGSVSNSSDDLTLSKPYPIDNGEDNTGNNSEEKIEGGRYYVSDQDVYALFTQINYKPMNRLKLTLGIRVERHLQFDTRLGIRRGGHETVYPMALYNEGGKDYFIPRVAGVYSLTDHHIIKLMYGEAIKPLSFEDMDVGELDLDELDDILNEEWIRRDLDPERIKTLELNYLYSRSDLGLGFSLFMNDIENLQSASYQKDEMKRARENFENSGRMVSHGVELILSYRPIDMLDLGFGATWQKSRSKADGDDVIAYSPNLLLKARCAYRWRGFTIAATGLFVDEMDPWVEKETDPSENNDSLEKPRSTDAFFLANVNLRYDHEKTGLFGALNISNIFDEEVRYPGSQSDSPQFRKGLIDEGRTFTATVGWKF